MVDEVKYSLPILIFLKRQYTDHSMVKENIMCLYEWQLPIFGHTIKQIVFLI